MSYIAICDDEKYYREQLKFLVTKYITQYQKDYTIDLFSSGEEFCAKGLDIAKYDIVFLDISMNELNGIDTAYKIREYRNDTYIIFVTSFFNYALEGYKVDAIRYIMKDTLEVSVAECLNTMFKKMEARMDIVEFEFVEGKKHIYVDKIIYIESQKHKLIFYILETGLKKHIIYDKLDRVDSLLNQYRFLRIHKSYLVNMKYIAKVSSYKAILTFGQELSIPRSRYQAVKEMFVLYKGEL